MIIKLKIQWIRTTTLIAFVFAFAFGAILARRWDFCLFVAILGFLYAHASRGCQQSVLSLTTPEFEIGGFCTPEYESVLRIFQTHVQEGMHNGVQCACMSKANRCLICGLQENLLKPMCMARFSKSFLPQSFLLGPGDAGGSRSYKITRYVCHEIWPELVTR